MKIPTVATILVLYGALSLAPPVTEAWSLPASNARAVALSTIGGNQKLSFWMNSDPDNQQHRFGAPLRSTTGSAPFRRCGRRSALLASIAAPVRRLGLYERLHKPPSALFASNLSESLDSNNIEPEISPLIKSTSRQLQRLSWFSWWAQMILTTISTTILLFAASVVRGSRASPNGAPAAAPSFFLSGVGLVVSAVSILWTWGNGARLSRRLLRRPTSESARAPPLEQQHIAAAQLLRRAVKVQVNLNLLGLLVTLLAAEEIVGSLAIKVLTTFGIGSAGATLYSAPLMGLQPLDILVVQANTNTLLAQFISLSTSLALTDSVRKLDPPSTLESPRR